jgi:hypothetical protein
MVSTEVPGYGFGGEASPWITMSKLAGVPAPEYWMPATFNSNQQHEYERVKKCALAQRLGGLSFGAEASKSHKMICKLTIATLPALFKHSSSSGKAD